MHFLYRNIKALQFLVCKKVFFAKKKSILFWVSRMCLLLYMFRMHSYDYINLEKLWDRALDILRRGHERKINYLRWDLLDGLRYVRSNLVPVIENAPAENVYDILLSCKCLELMEEQDRILLVTLCSNLTMIHTVMLKKSLFKVMLN